MEKIVKIGGACGFYGDSSVAPKQLIDAGCDYLVLDYLAEATMSVLGSMRAHKDSLGYATDFTEWVWKENLSALKATGCKIVTNAGGVNPQSCLRRMEKIAAEQGISLKIAIIEGDDVKPRIVELNINNSAEMFTGTPFPPIDNVVTANAYLGATPIVKALQMGADIVITGRVVDSALTLGIMMYEFGWSDTDYDKLCAGSLAGHILECGAQGSGALFTDWELVPDWANIGYPIIEAKADGSFIVTKPQNTGGLVSEAVVGEQILYEVGDPQAYMLPDVVCDFTQIKLSQIGENRVLVKGAIGYPPTKKYKISLTHKDGERLIAFMPIVGRDAAKKAQKQAEAIIERVENMLLARNIGPFRDKRIEIVGAESSYGANARNINSREVIYKIGIEHDQSDAFRIFQREFDSPTTSMAVGTLGWFGGRAQTTPVYKVYSTTIDRDKLEISISLGNQNEKIIVGSDGEKFDSAKVLRPDTGETKSASGIKVPLIELAWARSGDKGDAFNIGVIARKQEYLPYIRAALSREKLMEYFAHEFEGAKDPDLKIYEVPAMNALNFHFLNSLGGGQFASLRLDPLAKAKAQQLLDFEIEIPQNLIK